MLEHFLKGWVSSEELSRYTSIGMLNYLMVLNPKRRILRLCDVATVTKEPLQHETISFLTDGEKLLGYVIWSYMTADVARKMLFEGYFPHASEWVESEHPIILDAFFLPEVTSGERRSHFERSFRNEKMIFWFSLLPGRGARLCGYSASEQRFLRCPRL